MEVKEVRCDHCGKVWYKPIEWGTPDDWYTHVRHRCPVK